MPWFSDRAGPPATRDIATGSVAFHVLDRVGTPDTLITRLNSPACTYPYRRFATPSRVVDALSVRVS